MASATMFTWSEETHPRSFTRGQGIRRHGRGESVQAPVGVVEYRPAFEAANLPSRFTASRPKIVDEPLVDAERFRGREFYFWTDFLNHLSVHWRLHSKGR